MRFISMLLIGIFGLGAIGAPPALAGQSITIQGKLLDSSGNPVNGATTQFRVQIITPDANRCVLYDETQTLNLSATGGLFSINLNSGAGTQNAPTTYTLEQAISNRAGFSIDSSHCQSGSGTVTYSPTSLANRKVVIQFRDPGSMSSFETIPEMDLNPVPYAIESRTVGGFEAGSVLRVANSGVPGTAPILSSSQVTELSNLLAGTSNNYMSSTSGSTTGARLPSVAGDPSSAAAGSIWFDTSGSGAIKYKDGAGVVQTLGSGGGAGTITGITAGGALTGGGTSGAVTVSLPATGVTGAGVAVGSASSVPVITYDTYGRLTSVSTAAISGTLPSGTNGEFLKYSGGAWGSAAVRMSDIKNATGAAALFGSTTCAASETFYWDSGTDQFKCQSIALGAPSGAVAATYAKVTVAADGRVNGGSATIGNSDIADLAWSKLTSVPSLVTNGGSASSIVANSSGSKPAGQVAGRIYVDVSNQKISYDNGTAWVDVSGSAAATPSVSVSAPLTSTSGTVGITQASGSTDGYLSSANFTAFANKLSKALTSAHIFVGNGSGDATDVAVSGDLSLANTGAFTVNAIRGTAVTSAASAAGQVLRYNGSTGYAPTLLSLADIRSNVTGSSTFTTTCTASQTLTWNSGSDTLSCQDISLAAATQLSGVVPLANGGTGTTNGSITGTGALTFTAGGTNQNVSLNPSGTGYTLLGGSVGIGTTAPAHRLHVVASADNGAGALITTSSAWSVGKDVSLFLGDSGHYLKAVFSAEDEWHSYYGLKIVNNSGTVITLGANGTGNIGIGSATPNSSLDLSQRTDAISLPRGTTAQAPAAATAAGMLRWNSQTSALEVSNGSSWVNVLAGSAYSFSNGSSGNAPNWSNTGNAYTLNIPLASSGSGVTAGLLSYSEYTALSGKASTASPAFTGTPTSTTAAADTNTTQLATTAFVVGQAATATPLMDGTGAVGTSLKYARGDHVHPTDTSRAPAAGSSSITTVGTISTGTWNGSTIGVAYGGTGATSTSQGFVFAGPSSGAGAPSFRALTATDLPASASYWQAATGGINFTGGNVGINTSTPDAYLEVQRPNGAGAGRIAKFTGFNSNAALFIGAGSDLQTIDLNAVENSSNSAVKHLSFSTGGTERMRILAGGNVGIGTSNPSNALAIEGGGEGITIKRDSSIATGAAPDIRLLSSRGTNASPAAKVNGDLAGQLHFTVHDGTAYRDFASIFGKVDGAVSSGTAPVALLFNTGTTATAERMRITSGGDVGIGTSAPGVSFTAGRTLTLDGGSSEGLIEIVNSQAQANGVVIGQYDFGIKDNTTRKQGAAIRSSIVGTTAGDRGADLQFWTKQEGYGTGQKMVLDSTGRLGIGTFTPASKLDLTGGSLSINPADANTGVASPDVTQGIIKFNNRYDSAGGVTTNKIMLYDVPSSNRYGIGISGGSFDLFTGAAGSFNFYTGHIDESTPGSSKVTIANSGNVGIGTSAPSATLEVNGNFIRSVAHSSGTANDPADSGQLIQRTLAFTKAKAGTSMRIGWTDGRRASNGGCQWEIKVDGASCPGGALLFANHSTNNSDPHIASQVVGYCDGLTAGAHTISIWVGSAPSYSGIDCYTGWNTRWMLEAEEVN